MYGIDSSGRMLIEDISSFSKKDKLTKAIGEPGVAGDSHKIIIATENIIGFYKELLKQKLSFEKVDASEPYRISIEQCIVVLGKCVMILRNYIIKC